MSEVITIGRTHYFGVRKGPLLFKICEGKRLTDPDHCWQVLKDPDSGKPYFINNSGVRRWHLPDIHQTDEERAEEEKELRFRRARREAGMKEDGDDDGGDGSGGGTTIAAAAGTAAYDFATRDRNAVTLKPKPEWQTGVEQRRTVFKHAKAVLAPRYTQGDVDERLFATIINTTTQEFMAAHSQLGEVCT